MIKLKALNIYLLLVFLSACWESTIEFENLVARGDVHYEKFSTEPFSGRVTGLRVGQLVDGRFEGPVHQFDSKGQLQSETNFSRGERHGVQRVYRSNGTLGRVNEYEEGELIGDKYFYDDAEETLKSSTRIVDGVHRSSYYHRNGALQLEVSVKGFLISRDTILSSSVVEYDSEGQQVVEYPLSNNKIHGLVRWTAGEFAGCELKFSNGIVIPPGEENRIGGFISDSDAVRRLGEMEKLQADPCFKAVREIPCPLCYLFKY